MLSNHFVDSLRGLETLTFLGKVRSMLKRLEESVTAIEKRQWERSELLFIYVCFRFLYDVICSHRGCYARFAASERFDDVRACTYDFIAGA